MKISDFESNIAIITELGQRIKKYRISMSKTQEELSNLSGVSLATIKNIELGNGCSVDTLLKILKVFKITSNLNDLIPDTDVSPIEIAKSGKEKQRVYKKQLPKNIIWEEDK